MCLHSGSQQFQPGTDPTTSRDLTNTMSMTLKKPRRLPVKNIPAGPKELPDYYIAPSHDFRQYTRDYEQKYWSRDTAFDWRQNVPDSLKAHVEDMPLENLQRLATLALPLVEGALERNIRLIQQSGLPLENDALKGIGESLPFDRGSVQQALSIHEPWNTWSYPLVA